MDEKELKEIKQMAMGYSDPIRGKILALIAALELTQVATTVQTNQNPPNPLAIASAFDIVMDTLAFVERETGVGPILRRIKDCRQQLQVLGIHS